MSSFCQNVEIIELELCGALYCFGLYLYAWTGDQSIPKAAPILLIVHDARDDVSTLPRVPATTHDKILIFPTFPRILT